MEIEKADFEPLCPHCGLRIDKLVVVKRGAFVAHRVFCCPHCKKIIGVTSATS